MFLMPTKRDGSSSTPRFQGIFLSILFCFFLLHPLQRAKRRIHTAVLTYHSSFIFCLILILSLSFLSRFLHNHIENKSPRVLRGWRGSLAFPMREGRGRAGEVNGAWTSWHKKIFWNKNSYDTVQTMYEFVINGAFSGASVRHSIAFIRQQIAFGQDANIKEIIICAPVLGLKRYTLSKATNKSVRIQLPPLS